jgi:hypothetical protein
MIHGVRRVRGNRRWRRLATSAAAFLSAVMCLLFAGPQAMAATAFDDWTTNITVPVGDLGTCITSGYVDSISGTLCIEFGAYASGSQHYLTPQVLGYCYNESTGKDQQCSNVYASATIANGAGAGGGFSTLICGHTFGNCYAGENWFYPFEAIPIGDPGCVNNVWVVLQKGSYITLPVSDENFTNSINFEDYGHFSSVCIESNGELEAFR